MQRDGGSLQVNSMQSDSMIVSHEWASVTAGYTGTNITLLSLVSSLLIHGKCYFILNYSITISHLNIQSCKLKTEVSFLDVINGNINVAHYPGEDELCKNNNNNNKKNFLVCLK